MWLGIAVISLLLIFWAILDTRKPKDFPPGPRWWPLFGSVFFLRELLRRAGCQYLAWKVLAGRYGPVCGLRIGLTQHVVLVSGRPTVAQVLENQDFDGRPNNFTSQFRTMGEKRGVLTTDGKCWEKHRPFLVESMGTSNMDNLISEEVKKGVSSLFLVGNQNVVKGNLLHHQVQLTVLNVLWKWISGVRFEDDDPSRVKFLQMSKDFLNLPDIEESLSFIPELRYMLTKDCGYSHFAKVHIQIWTKLSELVWEQKNIAREGRYTLIDSYLNEMRTSNKIGTSYFTEMQLIALIKDIIGAGSQTTSSYISFAILLMLTHQNVQSKVQKEIDDVVGRGRLVLLSDKPRLPYVNAVLMEAQRYSTVTATTVPHRAVRDTKISGYNIPENTTLLLNLWSVHMDEQHWGDPLVFRPERFIDEFGRIKTDTWFMPFGLGRRRCLGEKMAWDISFLYFSLCLQQLKLCVTPGTKIPSFYPGANDFNGILEKVNINIYSRIHSH